MEFNWLQLCIGFLFGVISSIIGSFIYGKYIRPLLKEKGEYFTVTTFGDDLEFEGRVVGGQKKINPLDVARSIFNKTKDDNDNKRNTYGHKAEKEKAG